MRPAVPPWGAFCVPRQGKNAFCISVMSQCTKWSSFSRAWLYFPACIQMLFPDHQCACGSNGSPTPGPKQIPDLSFVLSPERRRSAWSSVGQHRMEMSFQMSGSQTLSIFHVHCYFPFGMTWTKQTQRTPEMTIWKCAQHTSLSVSSWMLVRMKKQVKI